MFIYRYLINYNTKINVNVFNANINDSLFISNNFLKNITIFPDGITFHPAGLEIWGFLTAQRLIIRNLASEIWDYFPTFTSKVCSFQASNRLDVVKTRLFF